MSNDDCDYHDREGFGLSQRGSSVVISAETHADGPVAVITLTPWAALRMAAHLVRHAWRAAAAERKRTNDPPRP